MRQHTPGPWRWADSGYALLSDGEIPTVVLETTSPIVEADANLIAAAPKLLGYVALFEEHMDMADIGPEKRREISSFLRSLGR